MAGIMKDGEAAQNLKCCVLRHVFERDLFAISLVTTEDGATFSALGLGLAMFKENDKVLLSGKWAYNEKYDQIQLQVTDVQENTARGRAEIVSYLSSKAIKGVGPKTAERIYDKFGEESLDVLDNHPERLLRIKGISINTLKTIKKSYEQN